MPASDLFLNSNEQHIAANVRYLGIVRPLSILPLDLGRRVLSHIKAMSGMDLTEKRHPADGRWIFRGDEEEEEDGTADLRINIVPTIYGEDFAIRILSRNTRLFSLENLGMLPHQFQQYQAMVASPSGLILITGPTGSGKTATLYASLIRLNDGTKKINTIEDPVEYTISGLRQSQVNPGIDLSFAELLRAVLRQSPDVIMIGEIRDEETARTAVHAANSGIVVLATLHAPTAAGAIQSMRSLGVHSHFLATSLRGVVSQRLVRTFDPATRVKFDLGEDSDVFAEVGKYLSPGEGKTLYAPGPAPSNQMTGYSGLTGVFEVMPISKSVRNLIADGKPTRDIRAPRWRKA
jgi:type II secretory ATPase GspE/PulE/Tfp pilus assembly ATPase PilB-like protein